MIGLFVGIVTFDRDVFLDIRLFADLLLGLLDQVDADEDSSGGEEL